MKEDRSQLVYEALIGLRPYSYDGAMTYSYYHKNVKPKANVQKKSGYVCKICGYVHEGDTLPDDFVCPICKHGASDFEKL